MSSELKSIWSFILFIILMIFAFSMLKICRDIPPSELKIMCLLAGYALMFTAFFCAYKGGLYLEKALID